MRYSVWIISMWHGPSDPHFDHFYWSRAIIPHGGAVAARLFSEKSQGRIDDFTTTHHPAIELSHRRPTIMAKSAALSAVLLLALLAGEQSSGAVPLQQEGRLLIWLLPISRRRVFWAGKGSRGHPFRPAEHRRRHWACIMAPQYPVSSCNEVSTCHAWPLREPSMTMGFTFGGCHCS